jgi:hypothetical protein
MDDPKRLLSSVRAGSLESLLLRSAHEPGPDQGQREALWSALAEQLPVSSGAGRSSSVGSSSGCGARIAAPSKALGSVGVLKVVSLLAIAGIVAMGALHAAAPRAESPGSREVPPRITTPSSPAPATPPAEAPSPAAAAAPTIASVPAEPPAPGPPKSPRRSAQATNETASEQTGESLRLESALLLGARKSLRTGDCREALARSDDARARWPQGMLREEREAIAIEALECLGRRDEALERRVAFLLAFPQSVYARNVGLSSP